MGQGSALGLQLLQLPSHRFDLLVELMNFLVQLALRYRAAGIGTVQRLAAALQAGEPQAALLLLNGAPALGFSQEPPGQTGSPDHGAGQHTAEGAAAVGSGSPSHGMSLAEC
jgi:hypothetical protein